jgi:uncharacterized protein
MTTHDHPTRSRGRSLARLLLFAGLLVLGPLTDRGFGQVAFPAAPPVGTFVVDDAKLMTPAHRQEVDRIAGALNRERGYPVTVVTIRSLAAQRAAGYTIERYAAEMLKTWSLDADRRGYGLLLLVAADDRQARIELGSAWKGVHDGRGRDVMDRLILPAFRSGDLSRGIVAGVQGFDAMGRGLELPGEGVLATLLSVVELPWWVIPAGAAAVLVLVGGVFSFRRSGRKGLAWMVAGFVGGILLSRALAWARGGGDGDDSGDTGDSGADSVAEPAQETGVTGKW